VPAKGTTRTLSGGGFRIRRQRSAQTKPPNRIRPTTTRRSWAASTTRSQSRLAAQFVAAGGSLPATSSGLILSLDGPGRPFNGLRRRPRRRADGRPVVSGPSPAARAGEKRSSTTCCLGPRVCNRNPPRSGRATAAGPAAEVCSPTTSEPRRICGGKRHLISGPPSRLASDVGELRPWHGCSRRRARRRSSGGQCTSAERTTLGGFVNSNRVLGTHGPSETWRDCRRRNRWKLLSTTLARSRGGKLHEDETVPRR